MSWPRLEYGCWSLALSMCLAAASWIVGHATEQWARARVGLRVARSVVDLDRVEGRAIFLLLLGLAPSTSAFLSGLGRRRFHHLFVRLHDALVRSLHPDAERGG